MSARRDNHILELKAGRSSQRSLALPTGTPLAVTSLGRHAVWPIEAPGMLDEHAFIYFDGEGLFVRSAHTDAPALLDGDPVPLTWTRAHAPCTLSVAAAELVFRSLAFVFDDDTVADAPVPGQAPAPPPALADDDPSTVPHAPVPAPESALTHVDAPTLPRPPVARAAVPGEALDAPVTMPPARARTAADRPASAPPAHEVVPRPRSERPARPDLPRQEMDPEATRVRPSAAEMHAAAPVRRSPLPPPRPSPFPPPAGAFAHAPVAPPPMFPPVAPPPAPLRASTPPHLPKVEINPPDAPPRAGGSAPTLTGDTFGSPSAAPSSASALGAADAGGIRVGGAPVSLATPPAMVVNPTVLIPARRGGLAGRWHAAPVALKVLVLLAALVPLALVVLSVMVDDPAHPTRERPTTQER